MLRSLVGDTSREVNERFNALDLPKEAIVSINVMKEGSIVLFYWVNES